VTTPRYRANELVAFAAALLSSAALEPAKSQAVAEVLVEGDLLGHTTHGLQLLPGYLTDLDSGAMAKSGSPRVIAEAPAAVTWDGMRLPGPWLVQQAVALASERARRNGACCVVIRRSHHIASLAAYLRPVAEQGLMILLTCSAPDIATVAPAGGKGRVLTPNPIAAGWPAKGGPVMMDFSTSITSNALSKRLHAEKRRLPGAWALDAAGNPTDDPGVLFRDPRGSLLPTGGLDHGHKGFALALLVEALTGGLAGHGRADAPTQWTNTVFLQVFDPARFAGADDFTRQVDFVADACRNSPPLPPVARVRLPGETALRRRAEQLAGGVQLYPGVFDSLLTWARKLNVRAPAMLASPQA